MVGLTRWLAVASATMRSSRRDCFERLEFRRTFEYLLCILAQPHIQTNTHTQYILYTDVLYIYTYSTYHACMYPCMLVCMYVCMHACMYVHVCIHVCMYIHYTKHVHLTFYLCNQNTETKKCTYIQTNV